MTTLPCVCWGLEWVVLGVENILWGIVWGRLVKGCQCLQVAASLQSSAFTLAAHGPITSGQEFSTRRVASKQLMAMGSGRDSATEFEYCNFEPESDNVEWSGHFPMHRGGKVVFTLAVDSSFSIALVPEAEGSATLGDDRILSDILCSLHKCDQGSVKSAWNNLLALTSASNLLIILLFYY